MEEFTVPHAEQSVKTISTDEVKLTFIVIGIFSVIIVFVIGGLYLASSIESYPEEIKKETATEINLVGSNGQNNGLLPSGDNVLGMQTNNPASQLPTIATITSPTPTQSPTPSPSPSPTPTKVPIHTLIPTPTQEPQQNNSSPPTHTPTPTMPSITPIPIKGASMDAKIVE